MDQRPHGWTAWVEWQISHLYMRLHHVEMSHATQRRTEPTAAPPAEAPPSVWKEISTVLGALKTALQWGFAIVVVIGILAKRLTLSDIPLIRSLVGG